MDHHEATSSSACLLNDNNIREYIDMNVPIVNLSNADLDVTEKNLCNVLESQGSKISTLIMDKKSSK